MLPWSRNNKYLIIDYNSNLLIVSNYLSSNHFDFQNFKYLKRIIKVKNFVLKVNVSLILNYCLKYEDYEEIV